MMGANIAFFYLFDKQMQAEKMRWEFQMISLRERMQGEYYKILINRDLEVSKLYHDMKNHISFLKYQADENNLAAVQAYLEKLSDAFVTHKIHFTNQSTINAILNIKNTQAKEKQVVLDIMAPKIFSPMKITDMDLVIVLANCLDNAIEAVEKLSEKELRRVKIVILNDEAGISLMVENPVLEELDSTDLKTTKDEKDRHGFGIKNIKSIVKKYEGNFQIEIKEQIFRVKIYLSKLKGLFLLYGITGISFFNFRIELILIFCCIKMLIMQNILNKKEISDKVKLSKKNIQIREGLR